MQKPEMLVQELHMRRQLHLRPDVRLRRQMWGVAPAGAATPPFKQQGKEGK
jgi:hypothetical protein